MTAKIDLAIDPDRLSKYLEKLTLENALPAEDEKLPDLSDSLNILEELTTDEERNVTEKNVFVKQEPSYESEDENDSSLPQAAENLAIPVKNEKEDELYFIKSEIFSDEETEDNYTVLLERGGPDRSKKRNNKRKYYGKKSSNSSVVLDEQKLKFLSSGQIIQNSSSILPIQPSHVQNAVQSSNLFNLNILNYQDQNIVQNHGVSTDIIQTNNLIPLSAEQQNQWSMQCSNSKNANFSANSPEISFINSPESGYDTSHSSGVYSPPPPPAELQLLNEELEKEIKIQSILNSLLEVERDYKNSKIHSLHGNSSVQGAAKYEAFAERLLPSQNSPNGEQNSEVVDIASYNHCNILPNEIPFPVQNLENGIQLEGFSELVNATSTLFPVSQTPLNAAASTHDNEPKSKKISKERKISLELKEDAKYHLRHSEFFVENKYNDEEEILLRNIQLKQQNKQEFNVIEIIEENEGGGLNQTNLQRAVLEQNIEKIYALVEAHKKFCSSLSMMINHKDASKKTALDYAVRRNMTLVVNYLEENLAVRGISLD